MGESYFETFFLKFRWNFRRGDRKKNSNNDQRRSEFNQQDSRNHRRDNSSPPAKRRLINFNSETKSVFSRLSGPPGRDDDVKPKINSRVIRELPTREEIVNAQGSDAASRARNRRMVRHKKFEKQFDGFDVILSKFSSVRCWARYRNSVRRNRDWSRRRRRRRRLKRNWRISSCASARIWRRSGKICFWIVSDSKWKSKCWKRKWCDWRSWLCGRSPGNRWPISSKRKQSRGSSICRKCWTRNRKRNWPTVDLA